MKSPARSTLASLTAALSLFALPSFAQPIEFNEISLLVRSHESEPSIVKEVSQRKLLYPLTPQQAATLKKQGAGDSLIQTLRRQDIAFSTADATAYENRRDQVRQASSASRHGNDMAGSGEPNVQVFNLAYGHPINLSAWGGTDYEIAFYSYRYAGEDHVVPAMIDNIRTVTEVTRPIRFTSEDEAFSNDWFPTNSVRNWRYTPYDERVDQRDSRLTANDTVSVRSNFASRRLPIDWQNPVYLKGQPYAFYRVYGAGEVDLYYIGKASDRAARVAVVTR